MNTVTMVGTLTRDPEIKKKGETKVCAMRLAENGRKESPLFINVSAFGRQAETCQKYLEKGRHVAVAGQLRFREWEDDGGAKRSEYTLSADRVEFLPGRPKGSESPDGDEGDSGWE
jgi:single-strand DNA-binding protein